MWKNRQDIRVRKIITPWYELVNQEIDYFYDNHNYFKMKKLLKLLGGLFAALLGIILIIVIFINVRGIPSYDVEEVTYTAELNPESLERGRVLVMTLCASCHMNRETGNLTGSKMHDAPPEFGEIYSLNITQDKTYGIGEWTDADILRLLRTGIRRDGRYAPPYMAKLPNMSDQDINAIIAFLRSDAEEVQAKAVKDKESEPSFLTKVLCNTIMKPFPMPSGPIPHPDTLDVVAHGRYLAVNLDCFSCHSADFKTNDYLVPEKSEGYFGGGNLTLNREGEVIKTANLTPDKETGIGKWSEEKFITAVKTGQVEGERALRYPMLPHVHLKDQEVAAIYAYLNTIPAIKNSVPR
jgi:mono/diheme cytochrome c family protein